MKIITIFLLLIAYFSSSAYSYQVFGLQATDELNTSTGVCDVVLGEDTCKVTINTGDNSKIDINPCCIYVQGEKKIFDGMTSIDPQFASGENSRFIGVTFGGYTSQTSRWTASQKLNIVPLARLNAAYGQQGPGASIRLIRDDRDPLGTRDYNDRLYREEVFGSQYVTGGDIFSNATSGLILGQNSGVLYDSRGKRHVLNAFENQSAIFLHLSSNEINWRGSKKPLVVDALNYNPSGSGLVAMTDDGKYKVDTVLKSPRTGGGLFVIYGDTEYSSAAAAISGAVERFGLFVDQATSGLVPVSLIVQQRNASAVNTIIDRRPCFLCR